jgi:UDP-N-acetylmuramate dehydrogenase
MLSIPAIQAHPVVEEKPPVSSPEYVKDCSLLDKNSLGIPASCDEYVEVHELTELRNALTKAAAERQPVLVLGDGTNVVLSGDINGMVVRPLFKGKEIIETTRESVLIRVGAGENWHDLVCWTLSRGYFGLENLALIPGSCGAAPVQNIGAYGVELDQFVENVEYLDRGTLELSTLTGQECGFGYRESRFKQDLKDRAIITRLTLRLSTKPNVCVAYPAIRDYLDKHDQEATPKNVFKAVCHIRRSKLPDVADIPNAGSFFKNPIVPANQFEEIKSTEPDCPGYRLDSGEVKIPAAWLIERRQWKGKLQDGVGMHHAQALVLVNPGHKDGQSVLKMAGKVQTDIQQAFGITLEIEPRVL